jgi:Glycosyltransferase WbsX
MKQPPQNPMTMLVAALVACSMFSACAESGLESGAARAMDAAAATKTSTPAPAPSCTIEATRHFGGSCSANVKDTLPSGVNRNFANVRPNHTGSVNANCIAGKVHWSTGLCKPAAAATPSAAPAVADTRPSSTDYKIGTFYFPGWRSNQRGAPAPQPWDRLKAYPQREPLLGWYDDGDVAVVEQQLQWMRSYGIDYVVFDWYWNGKGTELDHGLQAYFKAPTKRDVPVALLWANHSSVPRTKLEFTSMVDHWISRYFNQPEFMKIDGKPVIFVFSHPHFVKQANAMGQSITSLLAEAEARARQAGHKGIYFVAGTHVDSSLLKVAASSGYSAFSSYNYHGRDDDTSTSFEELDSAYQHVWNWILKESTIPYIVPMSQGWDKRPWGGSRNPLHDQSGGYLPGFERHLIAARKAMDANPAKTMKTGVICCWNEFGEGSYIEPTKKDGFAYLEKVQKVFGSP